MKTIFLLIAVIVAAAPVLAQETAAEDPVVITAGEIRILRSDFERALNTLPEEYRQYASGAGKKQFAEDFLRLKILAREGIKNNLQNDKDVLAQLELMRENLVANAQITRIEKSISISDADLKRLYEEKKKDYEQVTARHILIAFKGSPAAREGNQLTEEQAKAKAEEIRRQILAGADFAALAPKESDDIGSGANGGDLGAFGRGQMVPEFEKAAFEAKPGELAPVVRTQFGYHVIKVETHDFTPFETVRAALETSVRREKLQEALTARVKAVNAVYNESYFGSTQQTK